MSPQSICLCECIIKLVAFFLLLVFVYLCVYYQMPKPKDNLRVFFPLTGGRLRSGNGGGKHVLPLQRLRPVYTFVFFCIFRVSLHNFASFVISSSSSSSSSFFSSALRQANLKTQFENNTRNAKTFQTYPPTR